MSYNEDMTINERRKYLRTMKKRYIKANRKTKGRLLDEMEAVTGLDRKTLIRLMNGSLNRKRRSAQRGRIYGPQVDDALRVIYESYDYICAERLTPNLVEMARHLAAHGELEATPVLLDQLRRISISTVQRRLSRIRQDQPRLPRKKPQPRRKLLRDIPMLRLPWNIAQPGHFETDLVHHCGPSASGEYACTLQMIDVATGWSERRAVLGRSLLVMEDAFRYILARLPFPVLQIHPDNGSEFFNHHMLRFWGDIVQGVTISRSRPFHKNDNPRVEQKNRTLVRAYLGDDRIDTVAQVLALNALYDQMWVYYNFFQPVMHLVGKEVIREDGQPARVKRRHDEARTPFDRLCQTDAILPDHRELLEGLRDAINPRRLRQEIYDAIEHLFALPGAVPGIGENVHLSLAKNREKGDDDWLSFEFNRTPIRQ
ncbi:MAG: DDE-type integrase/transposase/recombinase [Anaerolineae bacterium]|nr:DDE-type integrase/transposase/recombinase [Anaerolineae bacterium]